jgi:hypothetical protein
MAYPIIGVDGSVTSWGSADFYSVLLSKISPNSATFSVVAPPEDITGIGTGQTSNISGLRTSQGTIDARIKLGATPILGNAGLVTFASGYTTHARAWDLTLETVAVHDITTFNATPPTFRSRRPDRVRAYGSFLCRVDNSTDIIAPPTANATGAAMTLRYGDEATDDTIAFNANVTQVSTAIVDRQIQDVTCAFTASGAITPAGTNSILGSSASALEIPLWEYSSGSSVPHTLTLTAISGKTYTTDAFWTRIRIQCTIDQLLIVSVDWAGSGAAGGTGITVAS